MVGRVFLSFSGHVNLGDLKTKAFVLNSANIMVCALPTLSTFSILNNVSFRRFAASHEYVTDLIFQ